MKLTSKKPLEEVLPPCPLNLRVVILSTYPPKKCGIANYTKDLATSINSLNPNHLVEIIAMNDETSKDLEYPWEVSHQIKNDCSDDYAKVLDYLNKSIIDIVIIQHEFSIYGGSQNKYLLDFVRKLNKPFIITFHTILEHPDATQKKTIQTLSEYARAVVVLLPAASSILNHVYNINEEKIVQIHLGTPDYPFADNKKVKKLLNLENRIVMSSINLVSENKGIHHAIEALPEVVKKYPNFLYIVAGQTHPLMLNIEGESYRKRLEHLVKKLHLDNNVRFINRFISQEELINFIRASDFYITPYVSLEQISSYALAYAIAFGQTCISTPYKYAKEMLAGRRGFLVESENPDSITQALLYGLNHQQEVERMRQKCYLQGRSMVWARVGFRHLRMIDHLLQKTHQTLEYPQPSVSYLNYLTDQIGILEHTYKGKKNYKEGYATDDNARGLVVAVTYKDKQLANTYLNFLIRAEHDGKMYIDADKEGNFIGETTDGDCFGRTFWAAAFTVANGQTISLRKNSAELIRKLLPNCFQVKSLRSLSNILLGLMYLKDIEWDEYIAEREKLVQYSITQIMENFKKNSTHTWRWPEPILTYDNPKIPHALLRVSRVYNLPEVKIAALEMLDFLLDQTYDLLGGQFRFIGNRGWYPKDKEKALFDEQPIDAGATVRACLTAYQITNLEYYKEMAEKAFAWFHGNNILRQPLYNPERDSIYDGILESNISLNQGAESSLEYLLAYHDYRQLVKKEEQEI